MVIKDVALKILDLFNKSLPKINRVVIYEHLMIESNAVEVANYISQQYKIPVYYIVSKKMKPYARDILAPGIRTLDRHGLYSVIMLMLCKYVFITHGPFFKNTPKSQLLINLWHGVGHKRIRKLRGGDGIPADITVATSKLTKDMFSKAFGVPSESVFVSGYPRNDILLRAKQDKVKLKSRIKGNLNAYKKILIWMPTYRSDSLLGLPTDGIAIDNPFQIENFDSDSFNKMLKDNDALCIVKPHPYSPKSSDISNLSNLLIIDDEWICSQGITLYHLVACTDILISDVSSIILDYLLLDQPVICFSSDFEAYKKSRGFYFDDVEKLLPSRLVQNKEDFIELLSVILTTGIDPYEEKRQEVRDIFFTYKDANSTQRLLDLVFNFKNTHHNKIQAYNTKEYSQIK